MSVIESQNGILGLGIDISKKRADICLKNAAVVDRFSVSNDKNGIATLLQKIDPYIRRGCLIKGTIESTGNMWMNIYEALEQNNVEIVLANPVKTRAIAEAKIKSDKIDSTILADLARADLVAKCYVPDKRTREIRALIRYRIDLSERRTQVKKSPQHPGQIFAEIRRRSFLKERT